MIRFEPKRARKSIAAIIFRNMTLSLGLCCLFLVSVLAGGREAERSVKKNPSPTTLAEARTRIAELERSVAELRQELKKKTEALETTQQRLAEVNPSGLGDGSEDSSAATPADSFDSQSEAYEFLNLGVKKDYIQFESHRLIDQLRSAIPPLYEPAFSPFHGYTLPAGAFRATLDNNRFINDSDFGRDEFYALAFKNVKVESEQINLNAFYGITENNTLRIIVPLKTTDVSGGVKPFRIKPMDMTVSGHSFGLGDLQIMLKHKWFDQAYRHFNLATVTGVQLPTGKHDGTFSGAQTLFLKGVPTAVSAATGGPALNLFSDDLRIPNSLQPGTGSWGLNVGVMVTRQLTWNGSRGAIHGGVLYRAMKDNGEGVTPGNELIFAASYVRPPFKTEHVSFDLTFFGRKKESERFPGLITHPGADPATGLPIMNPNGTLKMFTTPRPPFEHGTVMFISPSFILIPKSVLRLTVSPMFRIYEPLRGPSPAFRLAFGIQSIF